MSTRPFGLLYAVGFLRHAPLCAVAALLGSCVAATPGHTEDAPPPTVTAGGMTFQVLAEAEDPEYCYRFSLTPPEGKTGQFVAKLLFGYQDATHYYALSLGREAALLTVRAGDVSRKLASYQGPTLRTEGATPIIVRRAPSMIHVIADGRRIIEVLDSTFLEGKLALQATTPPATVADAELQPTAEIAFTDDFMRAAENQELGAWNQVRGAWRFHSVKEVNKSADFKLSVNPFSLGGKAEDWAMVSTGHWFWDDYEYAASLKSDGAYAGIAFNCLDENTYHLVRLDLRDPKLGPREIMLVRIGNGERKILASGYVDAAAGQWFRLGVATRGSLVRVLLDGSVLWEVVDPTIVGGPVGLYTEGAAETYFDDIEVAGNETYDYARGLSWWRDAKKMSGTWKLSHASGTRKILNGNGPTRVSQTGRGEAAYLLGDARWQTPIVVAKATPGKSGALGLLFDYKDPKDYKLARITGPVGSPNARVQFVSCAEGNPTVVQEAPGGYVPDAANALRLDLSQPGEVKLYVNDRLELAADEPEPPAGRQGRQGLYTSGAAATFETVAIRLKPEDDIEVPVEREAFVKDPYMQHWASPIGEWFPVKGQENTYWHKGDFYAAYSLTIPLVADTHLTFGAKEMSFEDGYALDVAASEEEGKLDLSLSKLGHLKAKATVPAAKGATFTLDKDGRYVWVRSGEQKCLEFRDAEPLTGTHVGLTSKNAVSTAAIKVTRHHVKDFLFEKAPASWLQWGTWEITNRFSCTPTWSHMAGRSRYAAILWNKDALAGDYTIEYYAGMRMSTTKSMSYPRVGDMNVTFAAKAPDFSTGYSYLVGAWDPGWTSKFTKLLRNTETAVETDRPLVPRVRTGSGTRYIPVPYIASGRDVHGAWYYCKVRRIGKKIECYYDQELVLTYEDDDPLPGHRFGIWTYDNDMVVACVKVSYDKLWAPDRFVPPPPEETPALDARRVLLTANCTETPSLFADFERGEGGWAPATPELTSEVAVAADTSGASKRCLRVKGLTFGGDMGVTAPVPANLDLARAHELRFRYRLEDNVKINVYVQAQGRQHFVRLTGPAESSPLRQSLGRLDVVADGGWHEARFDLAAALRELYPDAAAIPLQSLRFGNFHPGYLEAGIGGNPLGSTYDLDDVHLATAGGPVRSFTWTAAMPDGKEQPPALQYAVAVDDSPDTEPEELLAEGAGAAYKVEGLTDGLHYFHVRGKTKEGAWTPTAHLPVAASISALTCTSVSPEAGKSWGGAPISLALEPATGLNLDFSRSSLTVNGTAVPLNSPAVSYDWRHRKLTFDAQRSTLTFEHGKPVSLSLAAATAVAEPTTIAWETTFDRGLDETPPRPVTLAGQFVRDDFEEGIGSWSNLGGASYAVTVPDDTTAASGNRSLRIVNPVLTGAWNVRPTSTAFSLGKYPLLTFDYKVPEEICADLIFTLNGQSRAITFADTDNTMLKLGAAADVAKDNEWHRATLNLGEMARALPFAPTQYDATQVYFADSGYQAAAPGAFFNVDNFALVPVESGAVGVKVNFVAHDPSGIAKFRYKWSAHAEDAPDQELPGDQPEQVFKVAEEGLQYLHVQAQDGAGHWSEPRHYAFLIDNTAPSVASTTPAQNGPIGTRTLQVKFADAGSAPIDPKSIAFTVNDKVHTPTALDTSFAASQNQLSWAWCVATDMFSGPVADGTSVKFALSPVKDFAGNTGAAQEWTHTVSYAADKEPPLPPEVTCSTHTSVTYDTFTRGIGQWQQYGSAYGSTVSRVFDAAKGDYVVAVQLGAGSSYGAYIRSADYDLAAHPMVSFDYRLPKGVQVFFHVYVNGAWYAVQLSGKSRSYTNVGAVPGIAADGNWHTATANLYELIKAKVSAKTYTVKYLVISNYGGKGNVVNFDNFHLFGPGANAATFSWKTLDPTGIKAYSYALDNAVGTTPDDQPEGAANTATLPDLKPGLYYLHLKAQDGAGNWGPPVHYAYRVG